MTPPLPDLDALLREQEWLRRLARRLLGDGPDADDLAQETLTRALRHADGAQTSIQAATSAPTPDPKLGRPSVRGWLGTIARNLRRERGREAARRESREKAAAKTEAAGTPVDTEAIDRTLLRQSLVDEVLRLPEPERSPLILHYFEGLAHAEIAERLGIPSTTSRKRVSRGVARLRAAMASRPKGLACLGPLLIPLGAGRISLTAATTSLTAPIGAPTGAAIPVAALAMTLKAKLAVSILGAVLAAVVVMQSLTSPERAVGLGNPRGPDVGSSSLVVPEAEDPSSRNPSTEPSERQLASVEPAAALAAVTHAVVGRVVDTGRHPVSGASVALGAVQGVPGPSEVKTAADGTFRIEVVLAPADPRVPRRLAVVARGAGDHAAAAFPYTPRPAEGLVRDVDVGTLVLDRSHSLAVSVQGLSATVDVTISHERLPWGTFLTGADGQVMIRDLPPGPVYLAATNGDREARAMAFVPEDDTVRLDPRQAGAVEVTLLDQATGAPVAGATLNIVEPRDVPAALPGSLSDRHMGEYSMSARRPELSRTTDNDGKARIEGLIPGVRFRLRVEAADYNGPRRGAYFTSETGALTVELTAVHLRTVRFPIAADEWPVPSDGTPVTCAVAAGSHFSAAPAPAARIENGELVLEDVADRANLTVETADGAIARAYARSGETTGSEVRFRKARQLRVTITDPDGTPVEGARSQARNQGNNELGTSEASGTDGVAVIDGLFGGLVEVYVIPPEGNGLNSRHIATADLEEGDADLKATLTPRTVRRVRLRLSRSGVPFIPPRFQWSGGGRPQTLEEYPDRGEIVLSLEGAELDQDIRLWMQAPGYTTPPITVRFRRPDEIPVVEVPLTRTTTLVAEVTPMEGERTDIKAETFDTAANAWKSPRASQGLSKANGPGGTFVFPDITLGLWRVRDLATNKTSETVEATGDHKPLRTELDLSASAWVTGIVEAPDPADLARVRILLDDEGENGAMSDSSNRTALWGRHLKGNTFKILVPGDREVVLRPWHPWLSPAATGGVARVTQGKDSVVLRLEQSHGVRFPAPQLTHARRRSVDWEARVGRYPAGQPKGPPIEWHHAPVVDGTLRCALPEGTWTLLVDPGKQFAPLEIASVPVRGQVELPAAKFSEGSSIVFRLQVPEGADPPRLYAYASSLAEPKIRRSINSGGELEVRLTGFAAGTYAVSYSAIMAQGDHQSVEVTVDGEDDTEVTVDFR